MNHKPREKGVAKWISSSVAAVKPQRPKEYQRRRSWTDSQAGPLDTPTPLLSEGKHSRSLLANGSRKRSSA